MEINLLQRAQILLEQRRYKEAAEILKDLVAAQPENSAIISLYSQVSLELNEIDRALDLINSAIRISPDEDFYYFVKARIYLIKQDLDEAEKYTEQAIHLDPAFSEYYSLLAHIKLMRKQYEKGLQLADKALELDAKNETALNLRSRALLKLGNAAESFETIEGALKEDPNNAHTHANYGWNLLEQGDSKKALQHFSEALKNNPNLDYAQAGMIQALKARYLLYRWFLRYSFWMSNMSGRNQWFVIIGFYLIFRVIRTVAAKNPALEPFLMPVIILLALVALSTWIIGPISNLLLRLNSFGKHLLSEKEIKSSNFVGLSVLIGLSGLGIYAFSGDMRFLTIAVFGLAMLIPLGYLYSETRRKNLAPIYTAVLAALGLISIYFTFTSNVLFNDFSLAFVGGFVLFQWTINFVMIKEDNP